MTFRSWGDVEPGVPVHHHCVISVESANDPKHWTDATETAADLVAWQPHEAVSWVRDQLTAHAREAHPGYREQVEELLATYHDDGGLHTDTAQRGPGLWDRLPNTLGLGRWSIEAFQLAIGRKLVFQLLCYADRGEPASDTYTVCTQHQRPPDKPYLSPRLHRAER